MRAVPLLVCCLALAGCDATPRPVAVDAALDAPRIDGGRDAGDDAGAAIDDTGTSPDGGSGTQDTGVPPAVCHFDVATDYFELDSAPRTESRRLAVGGGPTSFGVVYSAPAAAGAEDVFFVEIPSASGMPGRTVRLTSDGSVNGSPVVARTATGWIVAWLSDRDGNVEVYALASAADGTWPTTPSRRTTTPSIDEISPALATNATIRALAWAEPGTPTTTVVQPLAADGASSGTAARIAPAGFAMVPTAFTTTDEGLLVGWADPDGDAVIQPLGTDLAAVGSPLPLTADHAADGAIDAVVAFGGGAVVYGVVTAGTRHDVHAHMLDGSGDLFFAEQVITVGEDTGSGASIGEVGGGYVIGYRQAGIGPMLRVFVVDASLHEVARADLVPMAATGSPITLRVADDGNVLLTWEDLVGTVNHMRVARVRCN